jgi:hypothetical protein
VQVEGSLGVMNLREALKDCYCRCAQSLRRFSTWKCLKDCRKECVQESFLRLRVIRKLRKDKAFELLKDSAGKL